MIDQYGIHLGPLYLRFYGLILMGGTLLGSMLIERLAARRKMDVDFLWSSLFWMILAGIVGARIWHILTPTPSLVERGITTQYYLTHPLEAINLTNGGLGIPGAVIGGGLALYVMCRRHGEDFRKWVDVFAPGLALGQAIGRWGNFVNQEVYGAPTDVPWAITIDPANRLPEFADQATYHPIFLYESLWSLGTVFFLIWLMRAYGDRLKHGDVFLVYLITYPLIRIALDFLRLDASEVAGINANQTLMAVVLLLAVGTLLYRHKFAKSKEA